MLAILLLGRQADRWERGESLEENRSLLVSASSWIGSSVWDILLNFSENVSTIMLCIDNNIYVAEFS